MPAPQHSSFFTDLMRILPPNQQHLIQRFEAVFDGIACIEQMQSTGWAKKVGPHTHGHNSVKSVPI